MEKPQNQFAFNSSINPDRYASLYIHSEQLVLSGDWHWDLECDSVFVSDVMFQFPTGFPGTIGIIHPEDLSYVSERIDLIKEISLDIQFRMITTYNEVKVLTGKNITYSPIDEFSQVRVTHQLFGKAYFTNETDKRIGQLELQNQLAQLSEQLFETGTFYFNASLGTVYYSDQVFRIFGLPPQSLNAHLHTFNNFIHPHDKEVVLQVIEKGYRELLPLHITFRIIAFDYKEKYLQYTTQWKNSIKGEDVMLGVLREITDKRTSEHQNLEYSARMRIQEAYFQLSEQLFNAGFWQLDLVTRKTIFSDNLYKIYGVKPQSIPPGFGFFRNFVHSNDNGKVTDMLARILSEKLVQDLEFRIIRKDGKVRLLQQKSKIIRVNGTDVFIGLIKDITEEQHVKNKLHYVTLEILLKELAMSEVQEAVKTAYYLHDLSTGQYIWSDYSLKMFGMRLQDRPLNEEGFLAFIHPDDKKTVSDAISVTSELFSEKKADFRMIILDEEKFIKATFKVIPHADRKLFIGIMQDHTTEYRKIQALNNQLQITMKVSEIISDRVIITDLNYTVIFWNKACQQAYFLTSEQVIGKNLFEILPPLKNKNDLGLYERALLGENVFIEKRASLIKQEICNLHLIPIINHEHAVEGIIHIIHNKSSEVRLKQQLSVSQNLVRIISNLSSDKMVLLDEHMNITYWNDKCDDFFKIKSARITGKNMLEFFPYLVNSPVFLNFKKVLQGECLSIREPMYENNPFITSNLIPVKDEAGIVRMVLWVMQEDHQEK